MKALSITAWWAWAIVHAAKDIENRTWGTSYRGPLLIHASKKVLADDWDDVRDIIEHVQDGDPMPCFPRVPPAGGIVGRCVLADCVRAHDSPWFFGPYGFVLRDVEPVEFVPMRGRLGLFDVEWPMEVTNR